MKLEEYNNLTYDFKSYDNTNTSTNQYDYTQPTNIFSPINSNVNINILQVANSIPKTSIIFQNDLDFLQNTSINILNKSLNNINIINKKILVLDLDETLVHSSMNPFPNKNNIVLRLEIDEKPMTIYVIKRPYVDEFLNEMSLYYELIIFTASLSQYAEPLISIIDKNKVIKAVLNRESCTFSQGLYFKDLRIFNKDLKDLIIVDNSPISYAFNKENGIPILTWTDDLNDNELIKLIPLLKYLSKVDDVRPFINQIINKDNGQLNLDVINQLLKNENNISNQVNEVQINYINSKLNSLNTMNKNKSMDFTNKENYYIISNNINNNQIEIIENNNVNKNINISINNQNNTVNNNIYNNIINIPKNNININYLENN